MLDAISKRRWKSLQSFAFRLNFANLDRSVAIHGTCP